ncbi:MAG: patatin-like phospholipase family protein [Paracoccaceae bacterium]
MNACPRRVAGYAAAIVGLVVLAALTGCARPVEHRPLSPEAHAATELREVFPHRFWGDEAPDEIERRIRERAPALRARFPEAVDARPEEAPFSRLLAISGGGANGAFGAGLLAGWSESGERVDFGVVTGVSTGAIIAPFAFLGPDYDETLVDIYAAGARDQVFEPTPLGGLLFGSAAADTTPLRRQIERHVTPELIEAIAREYERERQLFIVTTHFDANRPVVWDIGAIATERDDEAVRLIREIIQASAAIPAFFPPVPIAFEHDGQTFTELHVDGGLSHNVFAYPAQIPVGRLDEILGLRFRREIYVIQNSNERLDYSPAPTRLVPIAARAINTLLQNHLNADLERIYWLSRRDGLGFGMVAIPESFEADGSTAFDPVYMRALIEVGREIGRTGTFWRDRPATIESAGSRAEGE